MARAGETFTVNLPDGAKGKLEDVALRCNCRWGDRPNISAMLRAIAQGDLVVRPSEDAKDAAALELIDQLQGCGKAIRDIEAKLRALSGSG